MHIDINIKENLNFAKENLSQEFDITLNLDINRSGKWKNKACYQFVDSSNANKPRSAWQFKDNLILEHPEYGTLILDILENNQLGGIEFYKFLN